MHANWDQVLSMCAQWQSIAAMQVCILLLPASAVTIITISSINIQ